MKFNEIIPASDKLSQELSSISGGVTSSAIECDSGAICESGRYEPDEPEDPSYPIDPIYTTM